MLTTTAPVWAAAILTGTITVDTIEEDTPGAGVTIDGVLNKDSAVTASSGFTGALTGTVTGNVTGNVTGDVVGDVTGDLTGDLLGTPLAPTPSAADSSTKVATTAFVQGEVATMFKTVTAVTGSRALGSTYTNNTGRPISIYVKVFSAGGTDVKVGMYLDSVLIAEYEGGSSFYNTGTVIVPNGSTYKATSVAVLSTWYEIS